MDTITIVINKQAYKYNQAIQLFNSFDNVTEISRSGKHTLSGNHKNFKFFLSEECFKATGSLAKLITGTNQFNLDHKINKQALQYLSQLLNCNLDNSKLTRIDYGHNLLMDYPVINYLQLLSRLKSAKKHTFGVETVDFRNYKRNLIFYDKIAELNAHHGIVPFNKGQNMLRYEVRFISRLSQQFNVPEVTCKMITEEWFHKMLVKKWYEEYNKIDKFHTPEISLNFTNPTSLVTSLAVNGIQQRGGFNAIYEQVYVQSKGNSQRRHKLINKLKRLSNSTASLSSKTLLDELDLKIQQAIGYN